MAAAATADYRPHLVYNVVLVRLQRLKLFKAFLLIFFFKYAEAREAAASAEKSLFLAKEEADNHAATARFIGKTTKQVKPSTRYPQQLTIPRPQDRAFDAAEQAALDAESEAQEAALASQKQLALAKKQAALAAANANKSVRVLTKTKKSASKDPKKVIRIKEYSNVGQ